jgi:hypothetical protein
LNVSSSPYGRGKVGLYKVIKQIKFKLFKTIKVGVYMLSYVVDTHPAESLYMRITVEIFQK